MSRALILQHRQEQPEGAEQRHKSSSWLIKNNTAFCAKRKEAFGGNNEAVCAKRKRGVCGGNNKAFCAKRRGYFVRKRPSIKASGNDWSSSLKTRSEFASMMLAFPSPTKYAGATVILEGHHHRRP
jgi:hypothetical protein